MKNPRFRTVYLLLLIFFSFGWMIDKSEAQNKNPFLSLTEEQLLSLPGKSIKDSFVQALLNNKECKWDIIIGGEYIIKSEFQDHIYSSYDFGIAITYSNDTIKGVALLNDYKDEFENKLWKHFKGIIPYGLKFSMDDKSVKKKLNKYKCDSSGSSLTFWDIKMIIFYKGNGINNSIINTFLFVK